MPTFMKHMTVWTARGTLMALALMLTAAIAPQTAQAEVASLDAALQPMSIGDADAPVVMHEYSSLTCPHCAAFHTDTLPKIKKDYVDTGKVRIVFHDFPLDNLALAGVMIVRCAGPERNVDFFNMLYDTQADWTRADNPRSALVTLARFYGMDADDVNACLTNENLMQTIIENRNSAADRHGIESTPTFIVDGAKIPGNLPYADFQDALDDALAAKGAD